MTDVQLLTTNLLTSTLSPRIKRGLRRFLVRTSNHDSHSQLTNSNYSDLYRVVNLPSFPFHSEGDAVGANDVVKRFSPSELLGGFLVGPENRLVELAYRFAINGVPIFDRAIGATSLDPVVRVSAEPSRADVELLLRAAKEGNVDSFFERDKATPAPSSPLFDMARFNAERRSPDVPAIRGYRRLEELTFLTPLVVYGPSGSGKTSIVEGICQSRRVSEPQKTLYYLSAADFSRSLTDSIRRDQTRLFRQLLSQAHVIAIEDADLFSEKDTTQQEFLPILDDAIRTRKLVILTFSRNPATIQGFIPDLAARLVGGLLIPTYSPTDETMRVVVDRVASQLALPFNDEMRELCVQKIPSSIGVICATLVQAAHTLAATRQPLTLEFLDEFLSHRNPSASWSLERIVKTVAKYYAVSVVEMRSKKRSKTLALARSCVVFLARRLTNATFQEIGRQFSNRDHSTMIHAAHEIEEALKTDEELKFHLREITRLLKAENHISF